MQCCVPFCVNTSDNASTSAGTGITFHELSRLPREESLHAAWLRTLGTQDHHLPDPAVVCSQHFLDEDFSETKSCVRQIRSNAIPTTVQMCMICLDTDSKLSLMSEHKLEETYEQLTGLSLCRGGNLKQTLCVLCAQRLINFSRFRDLCLRAHSLMTDLLAQDESITIQHKELMNCATKHLQCNLTQTTLGADYCDLYIDHTDEEEQTAAEESVVKDVASVVVKNEYSSDSMSNADNSTLVHKDDNDRNRSNNDCVLNDEYSDMSIELESRLLDEAIGEALHNKTTACWAAVTEHTETESFIKSESVVFECSFCDKEFLQEITYLEHLSKHSSFIQVAGGEAACDASQVCEPRAAVSRSGDSLVLQNKTGSRRLNDVPPPAADCAQALVAPLSARLAANNDYKVQATEEAAATRKTEQILETGVGKLNKQSSQNGTEIYTDINRFTNCVVQLYDIFKKPKKPVLDENPRLKTHTDAKPYSCEMCNYKCTHKSSLRQHMKTHTGEKPFCCKVCNYKSALKHHILNHMKTHNGEKPFCCEICNYRCAQKDNLKKHKRIHTGEKRFSCDICNYKCIQKHHLLYHMKTHTDAKPYSCEMCNYKCARKHHLLYHMKTHTGEKPFSGKICNYKCTVKSNLLQHMRTHTGEKPFCCEICNYKCAQKGDLKKHKKIHTGEKPFSCEICNYKCARKQHLLDHMKTHTGEKPYSCQICNYKCIQKHHLLDHMKTHTGEKPFSCEICNYKSARKHNLLQHMKTHTSEKPFCCEICNYRSAHKGDIKKHKRTHTGEKPFCCEICNYKCSHKGALNRHKRIHTGDKPFSCETCNYKSAERCNLLQHKMRMHTQTKSQ
ncbi:zinc finger protein 84-like isoform X2 [Bicyclus anynana]|uniref:Zinc finger protein 84-like isoform X2 n=1 Tax=Bicyclus anynana TaxID=110368 RepID=A0ABM3M2L3_BICAN|nr:zinc finger protein 84-like isoform X2 [Bicyclus anynana]